VLGLNLSEFHTGYRAYSRHVLETVRYHLNSGSFVFDTEFCQAVLLGFRIGRFRAAATADSSTIASAKPDLRIRHTQDCRQIFDSSSRLNVPYFWDRQTH
jgi:hypothetical protein